MQNLGQRPAEASSRSVTPDRRKAGLEVSPVDAVTLSDGEGRENARGAAVRGGYTVERRYAGDRTDQQHYVCVRGMARGLPDGVELKGRA